jgi:hypothetical protein
MFIFDKVWFQNKRSKERKGKVFKEKETPLDDDDIGDDSQPISPVPAVLSSPVPVPTESQLDVKSIETNET